MDELEGTKKEESFFEQAPKKKTLCEGSTQTWDLEKEHNFGFASRKTSISLLGSDCGEEEEKEEEDPELMRVENNLRTDAGNSGKSLDFTYLRNVLLQYLKYNANGNYIEASSLEHVLMTILGATSAEFDSLMGAKASNSLWCRTKFVLTGEFLFGGSNSTSPYFTTIE